MASSAGAKKGARRTVYAKPKRQMSCHSWPQRRLVRWPANKAEQPG